MGDYTRFQFSAVLRTDVPNEVKDFVRFMLDNDVVTDDELPDNLPEHQLFRTERWMNMLQCASARHPDTLPENGRPAPVFEAHAGELRLTVLSSFKNYNDEIRLFCDWIGPYVVAEDGTELGTAQFEDEQYPIRLIKDRGTIVLLATDAPAEPYDGYGLLGH